ncbi:hypothetical protein KEM54_004725 [Ascosphaera aggregata]|nr:hypothetical protein KEM54_004725 [Ascosphaera aggregata]
MRQAGKVKAFWIVLAPPAKYFDVWTDNWKPLKIVSATTGFYADAYAFPYRVAASYPDYDLNDEHVSSRNYEDFVSDFALSKLYFPCAAIQASLKNILLCASCASHRHDNDDDDGDYDDDCVSFGFDVPLSWRAVEFTNSCSRFENNEAMLRRSRCLQSCGRLRKLILALAPGSDLSVIYGPGALASARCRHAHVGRPLGNHVWPTTPNFTPYDVLNQSTSGTYSKSTYFELVKLYHPDLLCNEHPACKGISEDERLRRYHLIVAAHEILSDPSKRRAFDQFGDNWYSRTELFGKDAKRWTEKHQKANASNPFVYRNGTWEDWQRYYQRNGQNRSSEEGTEVSAQSFRSFILTVVLIMGVTQVLTLGIWSQNDVKAKEFSLRNAQFLEQRKRNTLVEAVSHHDRVKNFLIARDPRGSGLKEDERDV